MITISKHWNNPQIHTHISTDGIEISMTLEAFKSALLSEIGSVATVIRKETFRKIVSGACDEIITKMKQESAKTFAKR